MRRVVVTGIGLVTPLGTGVEATWNNLLAGKSGVRHINRFDVSDLPAKIAGLVPTKDEEHGFNPDHFITGKEQKKMDTFILYGMAAAVMAVEDSGWKPEAEEDLEQTGVMIGSGIGGLPAIEAASLLINDPAKGPKKLSPFFIPACLINLVSGNLSIKYGFKGPNHSVVTACSTGAHAIGDAARLIQLGDANVMVADRKSVV